MKKKILSVMLVLFIMATFMPTVSKAAITPYFIAMNDTLLPFTDENMPFVSGGDIFVPVEVLREVSVWNIASDSLEHVRLYRGTTYVDFYTSRRVTEDLNGNVLNWPAARRSGGRFYVPVRQVTEYFGLTHQVIPVPLDIIADQQVYVIRIISSALFNGPTFVGLNRNAIRAAYNEYYAPPPSPTTPSPGVTPTPTPTPEPPPSYSNVTIHLSFFDITAGSAGWILDLLDIQAASGFNACFFVNSSDITEYPGLVRRITGSGHSIGIWLEEGTIEEYLEISALLFEAAKVRTIIVSSTDSVETAYEMASEYGLIFWEGSQSLVDYDDRSVTDITALIPREDGARMNMLFSCSEDAAAVLPGVYSFLRVNEYTVTRIRETVEPLQ